MKTEIFGNVLSIRNIEDCIRSTRKYTKSVFSQSAQHPVQGMSFPSNTLTERYEVYPSMEVGWNMLATDAWAWVWGDIEHIDVRFKYHYVQNKAEVIIYGGKKSINSLEKGIPGFKEMLALATTGDKETITGDKEATTGEQRAIGDDKVIQQVVGSSHRSGSSATSHP